MTAYEDRLEGGFVRFRVSPIILNENKHLLQGVCRMFLSYVLLIMRGCIAQGESLPPRLISGQGLNVSAGATPCHRRKSVAVVFVAWAWRVFATG